MDAVSLDDFMLEGPSILRSRHQPPYGPAAILRILEGPRTVHA